MFKIPEVLPVHSLNLAPHRQYRLTTDVPEN